MFDIAAGIASLNGLDPVSSALILFCSVVVSTISVRFRAFLRRQGTIQCRPDSHANLHI
jgi:hypothetical protein